LDGERERRESRERERDRPPAPAGERSCRSDVRGRPKHLVFLSRVARAGRPQRPEGLLRSRGSWSSAARADGSGHQRLFDSRDLTVVSANAADLRRGRAHIPRTQGGRPRATFVLSWLRRRTGDKDLGRMEEKDLRLKLARSQGARAEPRTVS